MNKRIEELFNIAIYEPDRFVSGIYYPYIPLQVAGEPLRYSITECGYHKFAELIIQECANFIEQDQGSGEVLSNRLKQHFGVDK